MRIQYFLMALYFMACTRGEKPIAENGSVNTAPTAPTILVYGTPNDPPIEQVDNLMCQIDTEGTDIDGDTLTYIYEWTIESDDVIEQVTSETTDLSNAFSGTRTSIGTWICTVSAFDGQEYSPSVSASLIVEPPVEDIFVYGTIAGQDGWSAMTNAYAQPDTFPSGSLIVNDQDDRGDSVVGTDLAEEGLTYNGDQSWWFKRGYDSPGSGTPYTPSLNINTADSDGDGIPDQGFRYQIAFKAADENGDGSTVAIIAGDPAGIDRASNYVEVWNAAGNLQIRTYAGDAFNTLIDNLDPTLWHTLEATMTRDGVLDYWAYSIDGGEVSNDEIGYFSEYRIANGFDYTESSRVKFQPKHSNHDAAFQGFFFDDLITQSLDSKTGLVIDSYNTGFE